MKCRVLCEFDETPEGAHTCLWKTDEVGPAAFGCPNPNRPILQVDIFPLRAFKLLRTHSGIAETAETRSGDVVRELCHDLLNPHLTQGVDRLFAFLKSF